MVNDVEEVGQVEHAGQRGRDGQRAGRLNDPAVQQLVPGVGVVPSEAAHS